VLKLLHTRIKSKVKPCAGEIRHLFLRGKRMLLKVLGSAAGGGFPQWNCNCPYCRRVRNRDERVHARTNNSLAISDDGKEWYLINATPDVNIQIEAHSALQPGPNIRSTPILGVLLTDAELDHTIGLLSLRQCTEIEVYAAAPVLNALRGPFPVQQILQPYASFHWEEVRLREFFPLFGGRLRVYPFHLGCKSPRYAYTDVIKKSEEEAASWVIGYRIRDQLTGGVAVYAPGIESWTVELEKQLENADCIFIDGTFWHSDELRCLGISELAAAEMGHIPISGPYGSFERLTQLAANRKIYIHINNTNPILDEASPQFCSLKEQGIEVGYDGLELEV
jgi:pyrroloquinoline quinone biosynthesis protein B